MTLAGAPISKGSGTILTQAAGFAESGLNVCAETTDNGEKTNINKSVRGQRVVFRFSMEDLLVQNRGKQLIQRKRLKISAKVGKQLITEQSVIFLINGSGTKFSRKA
jgi:hypothetical protein